jgi:hypothetical protein
MANVVEGEPRNSKEWLGAYLDEDGGSVSRRQDTEGRTTRHFGFTPDGMLRFPVFTDFHQNGRVVYLLDCLLDCK